MVVAKGDKIRVAESSLPSNAIKVEWVQLLAKSQTEDYVATKYKIQNKDGETEPEGVLFIQTSYLQQFKNNAAGDKAKYTIAVNHSFQYGQKGGGTCR